MSAAREPTPFELAVALRDRLQLHRTGYAPVSEVEVVSLIRMADGLVDEIGQAETAVDLLTHSAAAEIEAGSSRERQEAVLVARTVACLHEISAELAMGNADARHKQMAMRLRALAAALRPLAGPASDQTVAIPIFGRVR